MASPRNILFISDDQHRFDFYSAGAVDCLYTPHLDQLQQSGTLLTNTYASHPVCIPARFTWAHGLRASQAGMTGGNDRSWPQPGQFPTVAACLHEAGYRTAMIGKQHSEAGLYYHDLSSAEFRKRTQDRGWDDVVEVGGKVLSWFADCDWTQHLRAKGLMEELQEMYRPMGDIFAYNTPRPIAFAAEDTVDGFIGDQGRTWLESYDGEQPFYLHLSFCGPHFPLDPPKEYLDRFHAEDMPPPEGVNEPEEIQRWKEIRAAYCAMIAQIDDEVGKTLEVLRRKGLEENTLVVFCTDHGDMMGHKGRGHKSRAEDTSSRTPLILSCPGIIPAGITSEALVEAVDLPITFLDWAGIPTEEAIPNSPGHSVLPHVLGESTKHRDWTFTESGQWRMCCNQSYKYVRWQDGKEELYRRDSEDPFEIENLATDSEHQDSLHQLRQYMLHSLLNNQNALPIGKKPKVDLWLERQLIAEGKLPQ